MRWSVSGKMAIMMGMIYACCAIVAIVGIQSVEEVGSSAQTVVESFRFAFLVETILTRVAELDVARYADLPDGKLVVYTLVDRLLPYFDEVKQARIKTPKVFQTYAREFSLLNSIEHEVRTLQDEIYQINQQHDQEQWAEMVPVLSERVKDIEKELLAVALTSRYKTQQIYHIPYTARALSIAVIGLVAMILVLLGALGSIMLSSSITKSLEQLTNAMRSLSAMRGDLTKRVSGSSHEEVNSFLEAFNHMLENLRQLMKKIRFIAADMTTAAEAVRLLHNERQTNTPNNDSSAEVSGDSQETGRFAVLSQQLRVLDERITQLKTAVDRFILDPFDPKQEDDE